MIGNDKKKYPWWPSYTPNNGQQTNGTEAEGGTGESGTEDAGTEKNPANLWQNWWQNKYPGASGMQGMMQGISGMQGMMQGMQGKFPGMSGMFPGMNGNQNQTDTETSEESGYQESEAVKKLKELMDAQLALKPADYVSQYKTQLDSMMNDIMNRKEFSYDVNADALYQMLKDRTVNLGQQAMMDTMGQAAALTGGYGNSNAQMVGQLAYQNQLQGLTDSIPQLYSLALDQYNQQGQDLYQRYGLLNAQEQAALDQWNQAYNRWLAERDFATGRYDTERGYDYGVYRDTVADKQWQMQFEEDLRRYNLEHPMNMGGFGGGGGGGGGGSYTSSKKQESGLGSGYNDALLLVENSISAAGQEKIIQHAVDTGQITKAGAEKLIEKVGNTQYTK